MKFVKLDPRQTGYADASAEAKRLGGIPVRKKDGSSAWMLAENNHGLAAPLLLAESNDKEAVLAEINGGDYFTPLSAMRAFV